MTSAMAIPEPGRQRIEAEYALQQQGMGGELLLHLGLIDGKSETEQRRIARQACIYALLLCFFFLLFGTLLLRLFDVPLSMVRVVGGVILTRVGFDLFNPPPSGGIVPRAEDGNANVAFVPLAMPIMFGPGAIATLISMASTIKQSSGEMLHFLAASAAIVACMAVIYLSLVYAEPILRKIGRQGIDAATRIVGFFVAAMGMDLIFNGALEFLEPYKNVAKLAVGTWPERFTIFPLTFWRWPH